MKDDIGKAVDELNALLSTPGVCDYALQNGGSIVVWDPTGAPESTASLTAIGPIGAPYWKVGDKMNNMITLSAIELRQPKGPAEPARSSTTLSRKPDDNPASLPVAYHSYLAVMNFRFTANTLTGGSPRPRSILLNVQIRDSTRQVEHCFPANDARTNAKSILNEMGNYCDFAKSTGPDGIGSCPVPGCTIFVVTGFNLDGTPTCACACTPDVDVTPPPACAPGCLIGPVIKPPTGAMP